MHLTEKYRNSRGAKSGSIMALPVNENKHTSSDIKSKGISYSLLQHDAENSIHITILHFNIAVTILRRSHIVLLLRAFANCSASTRLFVAAVFDEIDVRVSFSV